MTALVATQVAPVAGTIAITVNAAAGVMELAGTLEPPLPQPVEKARRTASKEAVVNNVNLRCILHLFSITVEFAHEFHNVDSVTTGSCTGQSNDCPTSFQPLIVRVAATVVCSNLTTMRPAPGLE